MCRALPTAALCRPGRASGSPNIEHGVRGRVRFRGWCNPRPNVRPATEIGLSNSRRAPGWSAVDYDFEFDASALPARDRRTGTASQPPPIHGQSCLEPPPRFARRALHTETPLDALDCSRCLDSLGAPVARRTSPVFSIHRTLLGNPRGPSCTIRAHANWSRRDHPSQGSFALVTRTPRGQPATATPGRGSATPEPLPSGEQARDRGISL